MILIKPKDRDAVLQSLRAGVVPRRGQHLIQVGRSREIKAVIHDLERVADGGTMFRLVIGEYGAGKTFFLNLIRSLALEKKLVTAHADLTPERRLYATAGQARSLFAELMKNLATRTKPEGGALAGLVERFIVHTEEEANSRDEKPQVLIQEKLRHLCDLVNGYDFASVIAAYYRGFATGEDQLKTDAVRWLRGEFTSKTAARAALGVRTIIDDAVFYDQLKLLTRFVRLTGYGGLVVCVDEMVNLYRMPNTQARNTNYEQILRMLNDSLQGTSEGLGIVLSGTPEFLTDARKGLYSYPALQGRLTENTFAKNGLVDFTHPVLRLSSLTQEEFLVLLQKLRHVFAYGNPDKYLLDDSGLLAFMNHCHQRIGDAYFRTPRTTITAFLNLLSVLEQNADTSWQDLLGKIPIEPDLGFQNDGQSEPYPATPGGEPDDGFVTFKLQ